MIPTYEETGTKAAKTAELGEDAEAEGEEPGEVIAAIKEAEAVAHDEITAPTRKSTLHLIERAIDRLIRAGGRRSEAEAAHLLEGIAVVVYDPDTGTINPDHPKTASGLRWEEFVSAIVASYRARFED